MTQTPTVDRLDSARMYREVIRSIGSGAESLDQVLEHFQKLPVREQPPREDVSNTVAALKRYGYVDEDSGRLSLSGKGKSALRGQTS